VPEGASVGHGRCTCGQYREGQARHSNDQPVNPSWARPIMQARAIDAKDNIRGEHEALAVARAGCLALSGHCYCCRKQQLEAASERRPERADGTVKSRHLQSAQQRCSLKQSAMQKQASDVVLG